MLRWHTERLRDAPQTGYDIHMLLLLDNKLAYIITQRTASNRVCKDMLFSLNNNIKYIDMVRSSSETATGQIQRVDEMRRLVAWLPGAFPFSPGRDSVQPTLRHREPIRERARHLTHTFFAKRKPFGVPTCLFDCKSPKHPGMRLVLCKYIVFCFFMSPHLLVQTKSITNICRQIRFEPIGELYMYIVSRRVCVSVL